MLNVPAYLDRIGYSGSTEPSAETLRTLHRTHMYAVPFENLDIYLERPIVCNEDCFLHKIIEEQRGGFCYELNGAFAALLRALGFHVTLLSARVSRSDGSDGPEFDHLTLLVDLSKRASESARTPNSVRSSGISNETPPGVLQLADVGFGDSFIEPLLCETNLEQAQYGRAYRLIEMGDVFHMEVKADDQWERQYAFTLRPRKLSDFSAMCHYQQTSPESHFTLQRICSLATADGRVTLSDLKLIETMKGQREERELSGEDEWRTTLKERFGIELPV
jgi:N-hydroxyarylamine O-acetyltransferase